MDTRAIEILSLVALLVIGLVAPASAQEEARPIPTPRYVSTPPDDAEVSSSGLTWKVLEPGTGADRPAEHSMVTVHYTAWSSGTGVMLDSSVQRGSPATVWVDRVIPGWREGVQKMVVGEKRRFWIPQRLTYGGREGFPEGPLVFDVELLSIRQ